MAQRASRRNERLDLMKCIAIYSVIFLHILLPGPAGQAVNCLARFAVPLFFLSSGYFSWNSDGSTLARRAGRTGKLLLEACAVLLAFGCVLALRRGETAAAYLRGRLDPFFLKEILLYQVLPLPYAWPMWFLTALFFIYLLWWAMTATVQRMEKKLPRGALAALAVGLLAIHLSLGEVRGLLGLPPVNSLWLRNAWLDGFPFFALGVWMGERGRKQEGKQQTAPLWAGVVLCALLSLLERKLAGSVDLYLGSALTAILLLSIAIRSPRVSGSLLQKTLCFCGRRLTFYMFALHIPIYGVIGEWRGQVPAFAWLWDRPAALPFAVAALTTLMALLLYGLSAGLSRAGAGRKERKTDEDH